MSSTGGLSSQAYLGVGIPFIVVCAGFIAIRVFMSFKSFKRLKSDDYLSITGFIFVTVAFALNDIIIHQFTSPTASLKWLVDVGIAITVIMAVAFWTSKAPILIVYVRVFGVKRWLSLTCYATLVLSALLYIGSMVPTFIRCKPNENPITPDKLQRCVTGTTLTGVITGFVAIAADVLIFLLPLSSLYGLHLSPSKKRGIVLVFCSGILAIAASIVSLYYKYKAYRGERSETLATMLCAVAEGTIAIMVGCAPAMKGFWTGVVFPVQAAGTSIPSSTMYYGGSRSKRSQFEGDKYILMENPGNMSLPATRGLNDLGQVERLSESSRASHNNGSMK